MIERPILFQPELVAAIRAGTKTQTRRLRWRRGSVKRGSLQLFETPLAKVQVGDRLWVKESYWLYGRWVKRKGKWHFKRAPGAIKPRYADDRRGSPTKYPRASRQPHWWKRPSIFMLRKHSRILLEVTHVRYQTVSQISDLDAVAEGIVSINRPSYHTNGYGMASWSQHEARPSPHGAFCKLWCDINGEASWARGDEVVAITFKIIKGNNHGHHHA